MKERIMSKPFQRIVRSRSTPFQRIVRGAALGLAFIMAAASLAMKSFVFSATAMQGLQMLHDFAVTGVALLSMLLVATWVSAFFAGDEPQDPSDDGRNPRDSS